jgi:RND family efflux transporter MFP subunit
MTDKQISTENVSSPANPQTSSGRSAVRVMTLLLAMAVIGFVGVVAGFVFHEPIHVLLMHHGGEGEAMSAGRLFTCGMHPQVLQNKPGDCPICHMKLTPVKAGDSAKAVAGERKIKYWWDPMLSPPYIANKPGKSPMGMDLIPVYEDQISGGAAVVIDPVVVQNMGVRFATVEEGSLARTIRAVGELTEAEPNIHEVNLRVSGWIEKLFANTEGMHVHKGDPLFELYSPDLQVAIEELIASQRATAALPEGADALSRQTIETLAQSIEEKLRLWGIDQTQIDGFKKLDHAPRTVVFNSPVHAHLAEKMVVEGSAVQAGMRVLRLVDHSSLWLDVHVYEQDLQFVRLGQEVKASIEALPGREISGKIIFIHPHLDMMARTAMVRIVIPNDALELKPGMYATARIVSELTPHALLVPREAVIDSGEKQVAFVIKPEGHFEPRKVRIGAAGSGGLIQILEGLAPGEQVVTSGQFLLDSESRLREAIQKHLDENMLKPASPPTSGPDMKDDDPRTKPAAMPVLTPGDKK